MHGAINVNLEFTNPATATQKEGRVIEMEPRVWQMSDYYWWLASDLTRAVIDFKGWLKSIGDDGELEQFDEKYAFVLSEGQLKRMKFYPNYQDDVNRTFWDEYQSCLAAGKNNDIFACGE